MSAFVELATLASRGDGFGGRIASVSSGAFSNPLCVEPEGTQPC